MCLSRSPSWRTRVSHPTPDVPLLETLLLLTFHVLTQVGGWCSCPSLRPEQRQYPLRQYIIAWISFPKIPLNLLSFH